MALTMLCFSLCTHRKTEWKTKGKILGSLALNCDSSGSKHRPVNFVCSSRAGKWKMSEDDASSGSGTKWKFPFVFTSPAPRPPKKQNFPQDRWDSRPAESPRNTLTRTHACDKSLEDLSKPGGRSWLFYGSIIIFHTVNVQMRRQTRWGGSRGDRGRPLGKAANTQTEQTSESVCGKVFQVLNEIT